MHGGKAYLATWPLIALLLVAMPATAQETDTLRVPDPARHLTPEAVLEALDETEDEETGGPEITACQAHPARLLAEEGCMWVRLEEASVSPNPDDLQAPGRFTSHSGNQTSWPPGGVAIMNVALSSDQVARNQSVPILQVAYDLTRQHAFFDWQLSLRISVRTIPSERFQLRAIGPQNKEYTSPPFQGEATVDLPFDLGQEGAIQLFVKPDKAQSGRPQTAVRGRIRFHEAYIHAPFPVADDG